jgi:hypothetical protein
MIPTEQTAGEIALAGEHLALEPGDEARSLTPTALTFTIVQSGTLTVRNEKAPAPGALTSTPPSHPGADQPGNRLLRAGDAIVLDAGDVMSFENAGATRLDLMLIAASAAGNPGARTLE